MLHVFHNDVTDWFVAESPDEAAELAVAMNDAEGGPQIPHDELDLTFEQEPDDKVLTMRADNTGTNVSKTCREWARENGKGFLMTTEY